jgi:antitoxin (DNA-binding transcriptional repressor) of toxin-antitoxin stability system
MTFSAKDLRFKISMLFDILDNKEDIVITYRGKPKAKLIPFNDNSSQKKEDKLFGLWSDRDFDIDEHVRDLRKGRVFE